MLVTSRMRILVSSFVLSILGCSTSSPSTWVISRAEKYLAEGRLDSALRYSERAIQQDHRHPDAREISVHIEILRELDREPEADAFRDFTDRYASGEYAHGDETTPSRKKCEKRRPEDALIRSWGNFGHLKTKYSDYEIGTIATTFEIDREGGVGNIRVLRAKYPAVAWLAIEAIGQARISKSRLTSRQRDLPDGVPVSLCVWWAYDEILESEVPPSDWPIRGRR